MCATRSINTHQKSWKRMGLKNRLAILSFINDLIKKDEECRKLKTRDHKRALQLAEDKRVYGIHSERVERQNKINVLSLCRRAEGLEKHKRDRINEANRRLKKLQDEERERARFIAKQCQNAKIQTHKTHEKQRKEAAERERKLLEAEIAKINISNRKMKMQDKKNKAEQDALKKRLTELDRKNSISRAGEDETTKVKQQRIADSLRRFRKLEEKYEEEAMKFDSRMNELEKEKSRQREKLRKRNEEFDNELERRQNISVLQKQSKEKWKQEYISKLKMRITEIKKRKQTETSECCENIATAKAKGKKDVEVRSRRRHKTQSEQKTEDDNMWKRIDEMAKKREDETDKVIEAIEKIRKIKCNLKTVEKSGNESKNENLKEDVGLDEEDIKRKREIQWELEAKLREEQRIKEEFRKLMRSFGTKSKSFSK